MEAENFMGTGSGRKRARSQPASATKRQRSRGEGEDQGTVDMAEVSGLSNLEKRAKKHDQLPVPIGEAEALMIWESTLYQIAPVLGIEARVLSNGNVFLFMSDRVGLCGNCKHWRFRADLDSVGICTTCK